MEAKEINIGGRQTVNPQELISLKGEINYTTVHFQKESNGSHHAQEN